MNLAIIDKRPWVIALVIAITFFTINGFITYFFTKEIAKNAFSISNTLNTINLMGQVKYNLFRAESGQRGFVITGDPMYLKHFDESNLATRTLLNELSGIENNIVGQQEKFRQLFTYLNNKLAEMSLSIEYINNKQNAKARALIDSDQGYMLTVKILNLIEEMEIVEYAYLNERRLVGDSSKSAIIQTLLAANIFGLLLTFAAFYVIFRYSERVHVLLYEIEKANSELEEKVEQRTTQIKHYVTELERSNKELEDFAFVASHDLQEPLRKIRAFGDRLVQNFSENLGQQGTDYLVRMQSASERMSRLIEDLLTFSRLTTRQREHQPVDLNQLMSLVLENLDYAITESNAEITLSQLPVIQGDHSQIQQVFTNLLSNSLKFVRADVSPVVTISAEEIAEDSGQRFMVISVIDNGIGFDEQYKDRIFNLFQRLHGKSEYSGTGIGLAICRKIIDNHHGRIEVSSEVDKGTHFRIFLPIVNTMILGSLENEID